MHIGRERRADQKTTYNAYIYYLQGMRSPETASPDSSEILPGWYPDNTILPGWAVQTSQKTGMVPSVRS